MLQRRKRHQVITNTVGAPRHFGAARIAHPRAKRKGRGRTRTPISSHHAKRVPHRAADLCSTQMVEKRRAGERSGGEASVSASQIEKAADLEKVSYISLPNYGWVNVGSQQTQCDALLNFDDLRAALGVSGVGITVGVISDGIFGLGNAISSGDLPSTNFVRNGLGQLIQTTARVESLSFVSAPASAGTLSGGAGHEGTAVNDPKPVDGSGMPRTGAVRHHCGRHPTRPARAATVRRVDPLRQALRHRRLRCPDRLIGREDRSLADGQARREAPRQRR